MTTQPTLREGQALIRLTDGRAYQGHVTQIPGAALIDGELRVEALTGVTYRKRRKLTVPMRRVHSITWD